MPSTKAAKVVASLLWMSLILAMPQVSTAQTDRCPAEPRILRPDPDREAGRVRRSQYLIQQNPKNVEAYMELGEALSSLCRDEEAIAAYRQVIQLTTNSKVAADAYNNLGSSLYKQRNYEEALAAYQKAIQLTGSSDQVQRSYNGIGAVLEAQGKYEEAIAAYRKAIALLPYPELVHFTRLQSLLEQLNRQEDLVEIYRQELQRLPQNTSLAIGLGDLLLELKRFDEAEAHYRQFLKSEILQKTYTYTGLGEALFGQGKSNAALEAYRKAVEVYQPDTTGFLVFPACSSGFFGESISGKLMKRELYDLVITLCRKDISARPNYAPAYNQIGEAFLQQSKLREALEAFKQATVIDPNNESVWTNLAKTERLLNQR
ncbi:MAG: tetratricopeptide repeat protein [Cyanobacteriota bacterium]